MNGICDEDGEEVWEEIFYGYGSINPCFGGDRTVNVL